MKTFMLLVVLLVSNGLGAPVSELQELDKRRESTPEILNLEQELKKAAGEDEQYFSANEARPVPQIDGLAAQEEPEVRTSDTQESELPVNVAGFGLEDNMGDIIGYDEDGEPQRSPAYSQMWNIFQQAPDYFEEALQDYMNNGIKEQEQASESQGVKLDSLSDNDMISAGHYPNQYDTRMPADAKDRSSALMAEYFDSVNQRHSLDNPEQLHDAEEDSAEDGINDESHEDGYDEDENDYENEGEDGSDDDNETDEEEQSDEDEDDDNDDVEEQNGAGEDEEDVDENDSETNDLGGRKEQEQTDSVLDNPKQSSKPWQDAGDLAVPPLSNI